VKQPEALRYRFNGIEWNTPKGIIVPSMVLGEADALILRADKLEGSTEGSPEETELRLIAGTLGRRPVSPTAM